MNKIFVFGSLNMDLVITSPREVLQGETIHGSGFMTNCGGKGANQAVACGKLGGNVYMGGAVGNDEFGSTLLTNIQKFGVDGSAVARMEGVSSGVAVIVVIDNDNRIILDGGANMKASKEDVDKLLAKAEKGDFFLSQLENDLDVVGYGLETAQKKGMITILNPAPIDKRIEKYLPFVDYIVPNESEFALLTNTQSITEGAKILAEKGVKNVIVTRGSKGYCYYSGTQVVCEDCIKMKVVDTTAAGDTFCGAFVTKLAEGETVGEALRFANKAAALTVTKQGAQQSIPTIAEVNAYFNK